MELGGVEIQTHLHLEVVALCVGLVAAYVGLIRRYGSVFHPRPDEPAVTPRQAASFGAGVFLLWVASGSPLHDIAEQYLYSGHMVQHLLQAFAIPPLILLGIPQWMAEVVLRPRPLRASLQTLGQPLVAGLAFNLVLLWVHWPSVVDLMVANELFHGVSHVALIAVSFLMWLPIVSPAPRIIRKLAPLPQMAFLFAMTILPTVPASFLVFGEEPLYRVYEQFPRLWGISAAEDMRIAGLIMKIGAGFFLWGIITVMFFRWAASEEKKQGGPSSFSPPPRKPSDLPTT